MRENAPMSSDAAPVLVIEDGQGPYGQTITSGPHALAADEPVALGGGDRAPSPHQLLMAALGACTNITLRMYAERHGWPLEKITCEVGNARIEGAAAGAPNERFTRHITLTGPLPGEPDPRPRRDRRGGPGLRRRR
jgi:putative redox protein